MKVLLDAMYSPDVAARLRNRGHDAIAIGERPDLVHLSDSELYAAMAAEGRTIVTNNVLDYVPLLRSAMADGSEHPAVLVTNDTLMPRTTAGIGRFLNVLEDLVAESAPGLDRP